MDADDHNHNVPLHTSPGRVSDTCKLPVIGDVLPKVASARASKTTCSSRRAPVSAGQTPERTALPVTGKNGERRPAAVGRPQRATNPTNTSDTKELAIVCDLPLSIGVMEEERTLLFRAVGKFLPDLFEPRSSKPLRARTSYGPEPTIKEK